MRLLTLRGVKAILPDGNQLELPAGASGLDAARAIGPRLADATAAVEVDGELRDLRLPLPDNANLRILRVGDDDALPVLRHSTAHVMAEAVQHLWPGTKVAIGPAIEDGFYYDFDFAESPGEGDLARIEDEMRAILKRGPHDYERIVTTREDAVARFSAEGETYKVEIAEALPEGEEVTFYEQDGFVDLCRGPHLQTTKPIRAFKLTALAGAYWRGESDRPMLTRIYGTAFFDQAELDAHLERIEEARRRDHRRLGRELDLFHLSESSPGSPFWHPRGMELFNELGRLWRELNRERGYQEVRTPILFDTEVWKRSGHWDNYRDKMFLTEEVEGRQFGLKPMNCPGHVEIYNNRRHSYRDLPLRLAEQGLVHRNEDSGSMHGLLRVRHITQDDAHIFCRWDQVEAEVVGCLELATVIYDTFGLPVRAELSTRPEKRLGSEEEWDRMEAALASALATAGWDYAVNPGDGAFYAPKIDLHMIDSIGRSWQMGTIQLDGWMPQRLDATYTTSEDELERPFMIHRALFGSFERFVGILIEHFAGAFPLWLAPLQVAVLPLSTELSAYGDEVAAALRAAGLRAELDAREEKVGRKIRDAEAQKVPVMLVLGGREAEARTVSVRRRGGVDVGVKALDEVVAELAAEARERRLAAR
jgi:threonyl-tRNA synthetase